MAAITVKHVSHILRQRGAPAWIGFDLAEIATSALAMCSKRGNTMAECRGSLTQPGAVEACLLLWGTSALRRFVLATPDAQRLYERFGFTPLARPDIYMEIARRGLYEVPLGSEA